DEPVPYGRASQLSADCRNGRIRWLRQQHAGRRRVSFPWAHPHGGCVFRKGELPVPVVVPRSCSTGTHAASSTRLRKTLLPPCAEEYEPPPACARPDRRSC